MKKNNFLIFIIVILVILLAVCLVIIYKNNYLGTKTEVLSSGENVTSEESLKENTTEVSNVAEENDVVEEITDEERKKVEEYIDLICNSPKYSLLVEFDDINKANKDWIYSHIDKNKYKTYITEEQIVKNLKKIFGDELNINIEEDQNLIPTNSASNIPKLVEKNKYFLTPMGDTINVMYAIDTIEKREKNYIVDVVEYGEDIDNENILDEKYAIYSYKNNNWNKTFNLEENQSGKDFIIIENILKNKSDYNMYQIVILQENNNLYVKKIQRK